MYIPAHFSASEAQALALIRDWALGHVVWTQDGGLQSTPLPWLQAEGAHARVVKLRTAESVSSNAARLRACRAIAASSA